jgi:hypothetical protein
MSDNVPITAGAGTNIASDDVGGIQYQRVKLSYGPDGSATDANLTYPMPITGATGAALSLSVDGSLGVTTLAVWDEWLLWQIPATYNFVPVLFRAAVTTAGSRTRISCGKRLAIWNPVTNVFTDDGSTSAPDFYDSLVARITTTMAATANTVTVTYTNQDGTAGHSTAAVAIPSAAPAGNHYEFVLAAGDIGVRDVTAAVDTAAPASGLMEIWGFRTLFDSLGAANTLETHHPAGEMYLPTGESLCILLQAAAVTAQVRIAGVAGYLAAV